jgi:hypothetical protein
MFPIYMAFWSIVIILFLGLTRIRNLAQFVIVVLISALVLIASQALFIELSLAAGATPNMVFSDPLYYFNQGMVGWLALLIMPCGWFGPIIGLYLAQRWQPNLYEMS